MSDHKLLEAVLQEERKAFPVHSEADFFEVFCADKMLLAFDLSSSEIQEGIVDGPQDGGIDAAYIFINRQLLTEDFPFDSIRQTGIPIELFVAQVKAGASFQERPLEKLIASLPVLLLGQLQGHNHEVQRVFASFANAREQLARQFPVVSVRIFYCSKALEPNDSVRDRAGQLAQTLREKIGDVENVEVSLLGARELYDRARQQRRLVKELPIAGSPLSKGDSYVALCTLGDYRRLITDENGELIARLFEANVRAYQENTEVNKEIAESVQKPISGVDFWWLNNGVTIVADRISFSRNRLVIENPLVVNGLQTSQEIYNADSLQNDERMILIRVLGETEQAKRDAIIRATNRQTSIKHSSFRATEQIHWDLERYLRTLDFYYDRRKNFYKLEGRPANKIISIDRLAQATLAVLKQEPHTARARPTTALKKDDEYAEIFSSNPKKHPLEMYGVLVRLWAVVESYFREIRTPENQVHTNNLKFHVLMVLSYMLHGDTELSAQNIAGLDLSGLGHNGVVEQATRWVFRQFDEAGPEDRTAKDQAFTERLKEQFEHSPPPRQN